jgi:hypothetical protein
MTQKACYSVRSWLHLSLQLSYPMRKDVGAPPYWHGIGLPHR